MSDEAINLNPTFAEEVKKAATETSEPIEVAVGQIWKHKKTGRLYEIQAVRVDAAGSLRDKMPEGSFFFYLCLETKKQFVRWQHRWEDEQQGFTLYKA